MKFTLCLSYYENKSMLQIQIEEWEKHKSCDLIVIDDCSQEHPAQDICYPQDGFSLYRVGQNIPWHQHGCRNLAAFVCQTPFALFTDMDHLLHTEDAKKLSNESMDSNHFYMFQRVTAPKMTPYKPHPNSFLVDIDKFWQIGGYDEDFCDPSGPKDGMYGGDGIFIRQLSEVCGLTLRHDLRLIRYPREYVSDASTSTLDREKGKKNYRRLFDKKRSENNLEPKRPIRFQWERVY